MKTPFRSAAFALLTTALFAACSRPAAYFQPSTAERFYTPQPTVAATDPQPNVPASTELPENAPVRPENAPPLQNPATLLASVKKTFATDKRIVQRAERAERMLSQSTPTATYQPVAQAKKISLSQRLMLKSIDKKIQKKLAPHKPNAMNRFVRLGLIIGLIGLIFMLIGNSLGATLGLVALVTGLVLIILGVLQQG